MKRILLVALVTMLGLSLMGMGKMDGEGKPEEIPTPDREVTAMIVDLEGVTLTLSQFSINGQTSLSGKLGAGKLAVLLSQVKTVTLGAEAKILRARVDLTDNQTVNLIPLNWSKSWENYLKSLPRRVRSSGQVERMEERRFFHTLL